MERWHDASVGGSPTTWRELAERGGDFIGLPALAIDSCERGLVRGGVAWQRSKYLKETYGEDVFRRVLDALDPDGRDLLLHPPLAFRWIQSTRLLLVDYQMFRIAMNSQLSLIQHFGYQFGGYDVPLLFRALMRAGSPASNVSRANWLLRAYQRPARMEVVFVENNRARVRLTHAPFPRYICGYMLRGWARRALELSGGVNATCTHVQCLHDGDPHCEWEGTWK